MGPDEGAWDTCELVLQDEQPQELSRRVTRFGFCKSIIPTAGVRTDSSRQAQEQGDQLGPGER